MKKDVLILGGLGFIGTNLIEELLKKNNYNIIIFETKNVEIYNPDLLIMLKFIIMKIFITRKIMK